MVSTNILDNDDLIGEYSKQSIENCGNPGVVRAFMCMVGTKTDAWRSLLANPHPNRSSFVICRRSHVDDDGKPIALSAALH